MLKFEIICFLFGCIIIPQKNSFTVNKQLIGNLNFYVRKYSPLGEFDGWGLRFGFGGKAENISDSQFTNNKKLLIGTQKPKELSETLINSGHLNP